MYIPKNEYHRSKQYQKLNKNSLEYIEGYKTGKREERGMWVTAIDKAKGVGDKLSNKIIEEYVKLKGDSNEI